MKVLRIITYNILLVLFALKVVYGMVLLDGSTLHLDHLLQKSLRYKHHKENYIRNLDERIMPVGLHLNKKPAFTPVSENFDENWKTVLVNAEKDLGRLLLVESEKIIAKIEFEIESNLKKKIHLILTKIISFWKRNMISIEATLKRDKIRNGKSSKRDTSQIR